jgi:DNA-binding transcriptional LysR family regulator
MRLIFALTARMPMFIDDLSVFIVVAREGSFSAAARILRVAPSSVSRRVLSLERELGAKLLHKTTRQMRLTESGLMLAEKGARALADIESLRDTLSEMERRPTGMVRMTASTGFGRRYIAPLIGRFRELYPEISVDLRLEDEFVDLIREGIDVAVRIGRLPDSNLRHVSLAPVRRVTCGSPGYFARKGKPRRPAELVEHDCVIVGAGAGGEGAWRFAGHAPMRLPSHVQMNTPDVAAAAALGGAGIVHLPTYMVASDIAAGRLEPVLEAFQREPAKGYGIHLLWQERPPARTQALVSFFREVLSSGLG